MRELIMNGEPKVYHSEYTPQDITNFLIDVTCQAYKETGVTLEVIQEGGYTLKKTMFGAIKKDKYLPPVLRHHDSVGEGSFDCDYILFESTFSPVPKDEELIESYATEGRHLKVVRIYISGTNDEDDQTGYHIKMDSRTIFPIQTDNPLPEELIPYGVAELVKKSYESLDTSIMEPYLHSGVTYQSFAVFNEITSREEYLDYISGKFKTWKDSGIHPELSISRANEDNADEFILRFENMITDGTTPALSVSILKGRVRSFYMSAEPLPIDKLLPLLKETSAGLDNERLLAATQRSIDSIGSTFDSTGDDAVFIWLQHLAQRPCCQHMSFIYKSLALSIYIAPIHGDVIYVNREELAYYEQFRKDNHLTTVLLPVALDTLEPIEDGLFLDPDTLQSVDLEALNEMNDIHTMSSWEANAMACFEVCNYIFQNGYQIICFTNHPGAYPQIEAYKPDGSRCFIITNAVAVGNKDAELTIDVKLASSLQESEGFFVNRVYSNKWNTLDFDEVELLRQGGHYSNEIELIPLSEINEHWPNIHLNISYIPD